MCCSLTVTPLDPEIAETLLRLGLFAPKEGWHNRWEREIDNLQRVVATLDQTNLRFEIYPKITSYDHHHGRRVQAGVYFEMASKYAEKVGGTITQLSNIGACVADGHSTRLLAQYPDVPMLWENICIGFKEELLTPHYHEDGHE